MKKKRLLLAAIFSICILFSVSVNSVNAAAMWYEHCVIRAVGTQGGIGLVSLFGGTQNLPANWYSMGENTTEANQGMAVALTAVSQGMNVTVYVDPNDGRFWPLIQGILSVSAQ